MRIRFNIRMLLVCVAFFAIALAWLANLRSKENKRQRFVADEYDTVHFNSYSSHTEECALPLTRRMGVWMAGSTSETSVILVDFSKETPDNDVEEILSLFPEIKRVHVHHEVATPFLIDLLANLNQLEHFQIDDGRVDFSLMKEIGRLPQRPTIYFQNVHLDDSLLIDAAAANLKLSYVYAPTSSVSDKGLAAASELKELTSLYLKDCKISDDGVQKLSGHPALRYIFLENCPVGDSSLATLAELPDLYQLSLRGTKITDAGIDFLLPIASGLRELDVRDTSLTKSGAEELKSKCRVGAFSY